MGIQVQTLERKNSLNKVVLPEISGYYGFSPEMAQKCALVENLLFIVDKEAQLRKLTLNYPQRILARNWTHRMLLVKSRQHGISTFVLGLFFLEALLIPGLMVAVVSHEEEATKRLLKKIELFWEYLPDDMKMEMKTDSTHEKSFPNGSTIYIGTAGQRAFGRGDTVHRALVSEEAHYVDAEKILGGLKESVPISGYIVRESTPLGDSGYYWESVQNAIEGNSVFKLVPIFWWYNPEYQISRGSELVPEDDQGELVYTKHETELVMKQGLTENQIRWRRYKIRDMKSERSDNIFPQEYVEDLETCFIGGRDKVFIGVEGELESMSLNAREPLRTDGILDIWREPESSGKYIFWVDPCGGEVVSPGDPHDGVVCQITPGGLLHVASVYSHMEQKPFANIICKVGKFYNNAMLVVERNGVGKGVLNYILSDNSYPNLYAERKANGELSGKWGFWTDEGNKAGMVSDTIDAIKNQRFLTWDKKLIRQFKGLVIKDGKITHKLPNRDDRAMSAMGCNYIVGSYTGGHRLAHGDYTGMED
jgi:hypothetical protein